MRIILVSVLMIIVSVAKAQTILPGSFIDYAHNGSFAHTIPLQDSSAKKKWFFSKYAGLSASYSFFKPIGASVIAAPIGLQINRRLTNNLYAFAGVSVAPAYIRFNGAFVPADYTKTSANTFLNTNNFGIYSRAEIGLMYINPEKTFSISGSIGVEKSNSPVFYYPVNAASQNSAVYPNR